MSTWEIKMLYDGNCPICRAEVNWLTKWNRRGRLVFEDISQSDNCLSQYGVTREDLLAVIHIVSRDGRLYTKMDAFRRLYRAVGLGWLMAPTAWPVMRPAFDRLYLWFARNRISLGRLFACDECEANVCQVPLRRDYYADME